MKKVNLLNIVLLVLGIILIIAGFVFIKPSSKIEKPVDEKPAEEKPTEESPTGETQVDESQNIIYNYACEKPHLENDEYKLAIGIRFSIDSNDKILLGFCTYIYRFKSKEAFDNFDKKLGINATPMELDDEKFEITYMFSKYEEKEENETRVNYLKRLKKLGYDCEIR